MGEIEWIIGSGLVVAKCDLTEGGCGGGDGTK